MGDVPVVTDLSDALKEHKGCVSVLGQEGSNFADGEFEGGGSGMEIGDGEGFEKMTDAGHRKGVKFTEALFSLFVYLLLFLLILVADCSCFWFFALRLNILFLHPTAYPRHASNYPPNPRHWCTIRHPVPRLATKGNRILSTRWWE